MPDDYRHSEPRQDPSTAHEGDFKPVFSADRATRFLPHTTVEIVREPSCSEPPRHVLFDFDGTLSLIREGWPEVMVPMMVDLLQATGTCEPAEELDGLVSQFVAELTGKQTIYQMIRLAEEIARRGTEPEDPVVYKQMYHDRLMERIEGRRDALRSGTARPEEMLVPHSLELLEALAQRGVAMYLASGTDEPYVVEEARLLGIDRYVGEHIYGARDDYRTFSKAMVIERILAENDVDGASLLGFGDGYVEIQNVKETGGTAVAVASDESGRSGKPDPWKRERLIAVGADVVIPDYADWEALLELLFGR